jgi:preprotein translocase subunit SecD
MQNKYPLWKNILLVLMVVFGFIYALPNLYTEDPSIQISGPTAAASFEPKVAEALKSAGLEPKTIEVQGRDLLVRFNSTDPQLKAQDVIKALLGEDYVVALNLAPSTPKWLAAIGAEPMKQGLDLRGGIHFLLQVDVDSVLSRRLDGIKKGIGLSLRKERIRYNNLTSRGADVIYLSLRDNAKLTDTLTLLNKEFAELTWKKELRDDKPILVGTLPEAELTRIRQSTLEQTMSILRNRVNELGVGEAVVQQQGASRVAVDLPGIQDSARAKKILGGTATLRFHLVDSNNDPGMAASSGSVPIGTKLYFLHSEPLLLKRQVVLSGDSITSAMSSFDSQSSTPAVSIQLGGGGESVFTRATKENIGRRMAIVFVETKTYSRLKDGKVERYTKKEERVISAPVIQSALGNHFQITGLQDPQEAVNLSLLLRAGALPATIYPVEERTVGPSLGKENIKRGMISLEVGMAMILIAMLVYYRVFGLIANIALMLNLVLLVAILSLIDATLTLPGIAGIVLTVGMAIDANVLIYERIREELRRGISPQAAIYAGYERAFSTILDANITTLIVAIVLFAIGTGAIKGFAVTLTIGLLTSMITGIACTRALVNMIYGGKRIKKLSIGINV